MATVDQICKNIVFSTRFFSNGWGNPEYLRQLFKFRKIFSKRESCMALVSQNHPIEIVKETEYSDHTVLEAQFISPAVESLPEILPKEIEKAHFQMIISKNCDSLKPACLHLAGTGDHGFWKRRLLMAKPLLQDSGISSILLENPFYGCRKPKDQRFSNLRNVSDLFVMGMCLVLESIAIFHWAERHGFGPLGITGISMGGHMASLAASIWSKPLSLTPCLSWSTASHVFTQGVMSNIIDWPVLKKQYISDQVYRDELFNMIESPEGHFRIIQEPNQDFAKFFPANLSKGDNFKKSTDKMKNSKSQIESKSKSTFRNPFSLIKDMSIPKLKEKNFLFDESTPVLARPESTSHTSPVQFKTAVPVKDATTWETLQFMRGIMDECTHLGNYPVPVDPSLIIIVAAGLDGYIPSNGTIPLTDLWPGAELRKLNNHGHITASLFQQSFFRKAIKDSFDRTTKKYYSQQDGSAESCYTV